MKMAARWPILMGTYATPVQAFAIGESVGTLAPSLDRRGNLTGILTKA
jgi:hypothetical protein